MAQMIKSLPTGQETWVQYLSREDPLEKKMSTHSSILAWRILWKEEPGGLQFMVSQRVRHNWVTSVSLQGDKSKTFQFPNDFSIFYNYLQWYFSYIWDVAVKL